MFKRFVVSSYRLCSFEENESYSQREGRIFLKKVEVYLKNFTYILWNLWSINFLELTLQLKLFLVFYIYKWKIGLNLSEFFLNFNHSKQLWPLSGGYFDHWDLCITGIFSRIFVCDWFVSFLFAELWF